VRAETDPAKYSAWVYEFARRRFNSNNFATSADMTEECALLNAILVNIVIAVPKKTGSNRITTRRKFKGRHRGVLK